MFIECLLDAGSIPGTGDIVVTLREGPCSLSQGAWILVEDTENKQVN